MLWCQKSGKELDPSTLQMMIGGHTILVDNGKATSFSRNVNSIGGSRARTAVGYSKDGRYAYLIATESNDNSKGMTQQLPGFHDEGWVWKGMNLDGGGSTTMVNRPLAEMNTQLTFNTEYGTTRAASLTHSACSPRHLRRRRA